MYYHALAMSLTYNGLGFNPTYIYPATHADGGAEKSNSGYVPEGALLMLPPDFNTSRIWASPNLKKVSFFLYFFFSSIPSLFWHFSNL